MIIDQQLHGYRHGHELLSGTIRLPARDQDLIDRLSDIAGPIGPGEKFAPYLTCYPLPSASHYVVARTWLDLTAPRAGCVRTRSLIIPMADWTSLADPATIARAATDAGPTEPGRQLKLDPSQALALPPAEGPGVELLEALFLEDNMPVAVFGAPTPERLALRLLTSIWPSMRRRFTVSTFCNSPRTIAKRSFDLVFAPIAARSRFSDWKGRRIDGSRTISPRHAWSARIENEVLRSPHPSLLGLDAFGEMAGDEEGSQQALRLSLLWDELSGKISAEPHAALGLLDIANARPGRRVELVERLTPTLAEAAKSAAVRMSPSDAWRFLQVLIGKLGQTRWQLSLARSVRSTTTTLAARAPLDAVTAIPTLLLENGGDFLISGLARGLAKTKPFHPTARALAQLSPPNLFHVLLSGQDLAAAALREDAGLELALANGIEQASRDEQSEARRRFSPYLLSDRHSEILRALLLGAPADFVIAEAHRLSTSNFFQQRALNDVLAEAARRSGTVPLVRDIAAGAPQSDAVNEMVRALLEPTTADVHWILNSLQGFDPRRVGFLLDVLDSASQGQLHSILVAPGIIAQIIPMLISTPIGVELLARIVETIPLAPAELIPIAIQVLPALPRDRGNAVAARTLDKILGKVMVEEIEDLLNHAGHSLDATNALRTGLAMGVPTVIADHNLVHFNSAKPEVRIAFLRQPEVLAEAIMARHVLDLSYQATEAAAHLLWDSAKVNEHGYVRASAALLHFLMHQRGISASPLIAATFPSVYRQLQQDNIPEFLSIVFMFLDWDRCKIARRDLADALVSSQWRPRDIALAAARAGDPERILHNIARRTGGPAAISSIQSELFSIPDPWRTQVQKAIQDLAKRSGLSIKLPFDI